MQLCTFLTSPSKLSVKLICTFTVCHFPFSVVKVVLMGSSTGTYFMWLPAVIFIDFFACSGFKSTINAKDFLTESMVCGMIETL